MPEMRLISEVNADTHPRVDNWDGTEWKPCEEAALGCRAAGLRRQICRKLSLPSSSCPPLTFLPQASHAFKEALIENMQSVFMSRSSDSSIMPPAGSPHLVKASSRPAPLFDPPRLKEPSTTPASLQDLRVLRSELISLGGCIDRLVESSARATNVMQQRKELDESIACLEDSITQARESACVRFEFLEGHIAALEDNNVALFDCCRSIIRKASAESLREADAAKRRHASARRGTPSPEPEARATLQARMSGAAQEAETNIADCTLQYVEAKQHSNNRRSTSPVGSSRQSRRSRSPARSIPTLLPEQILNYASSTPGVPSSPRDERTTEVGPGVRLASRLSMAVIAPEESTAAASSKFKRASFVRPRWAKKVLRQGRPLPEGRVFGSVIRAYRTACESANARLGEPVNMGVLVNHLRTINPTIFQRHDVNKWSELMPLAQRFVSIHLVLTPLPHDPHRALKRCFLRTLLSLHACWTHLVLRSSGPISAGQKLLLQGYELQ